MAATLMHNMVAVYKRTVAPTSLPVTLDEFKNELDILDDTSMDSHFSDLLWAAVDKVESDARRLLMTQTWQMYLDRFPCDAITPQKVPIQSLTHVKYYTGGVLTTLSASAYQTDFISEPGRVANAAGYTWPATDYERINAVQLEFVAGYTSAALVPRTARAAVLFAAKEAYHGCDVGDNYWSLIERLKAFGWST